MGLLGQLSHGMNEFEGTLTEADFKMMSDSWDLKSQEWSSPASTVFPMFSSQALSRGKSLLEKARQDLHSLVDQD